ncbi:glutathione S-transferase omega-1-like [Physella acuta]|uniref:glutathione S-transferase omega-1-like n=1 Tax=Physella acuta TaxID=109671 RepID=UPI0027DC76E0|nr:glutathione S-transferase omega-1-like [Physella acuta]
MSQKSYSTGSTFPPTKPGVLRLYSMRFCPYAQRTRMVLAHKNIPYETINVNLTKKPEWFFEKNPLGLVPILELDDKIVFESTATSEWLDDVYPQNRLQPSDPYTRAWDRILLEYYGKITTAFYGFMRQPEEREKHLEDFLKHFAFYEGVLSKRGGLFFGGDNPSLIDFYIWPHLERLPLLATFNPKLVIDKAKFPKLAAWYDAMLQTPAVKATKMSPESQMEFFKSYSSGAPNYDVGLEE